MPVVIEAIVVSAVMMLIFSVGFFLVYLLAIAMFPVEKGLSKIIWESAAQKQPKTLPTPRKGTFQDFSRKH
ncbi:MAG TPA: hypothetical protein HPP76_04090 [Desulfuromonadales bacterium]|nr:hypothetical protein [Desulfuromonadales bacterium]